MTKKFINKNVFLYHNSKCKLRILTKNLVTFKSWDEVMNKDLYFKIMVHWKIWFLGEGSWKTNI